MNNDFSPFQLTPDGRLKRRTFTGLELQEDLRLEMHRMQYLVKFAHEQASAAVKGRRVRITHEWHDQPIGRSKPNLIGKEYVVRGAIVEDSAWRVSVASLWLEGLLCEIPFEYVELV